MPAGASSADVVLTMSLRMDPAEAARYARMSLDQVKAEVTQGTQKIASAYQQMYAAQTKEAEKAAQALIRAEQQHTKQAVSALKDLEREQARAVKSMSVNWHKYLEDIENVTVAGFGVKAVVSEIGHSFVELSREIIESAKVFGSLKQSIDAAREATGGTVKDMDLIKASNKAMEMGLELTGEEFGVVAATANRFADSVGIGGAEAMDKLIAKLASGSAEGLRHAGVIVDAQREYAKLSRELHVSEEHLTDEEKRMAIVNAALEKMTDRFNSSADETEKFGGVLEKTFTSVSNVWDRTLGRIGNTDFGKTQQNIAQYTSLWGAALGGIDALTEKLSETDNDRRIKELKEGAKRAREENAKARADAIARGEYYEGGGYHGIVGRGHEQFYDYGTDAGAKKKTEYDLLSDYMRDAARRLEAATIEAENAKQEALSLLGEDFDELTGKYSEPATGKAERYAKQRLDQIGSNFAGTQYDTLDKADAVRAEFASAQGKAAKAAQYKLASGVALKDARGSANLDEDFIKELKSAIDESRQKAGGGLMGQLLFGDDTSLDQTYTRMDEFQKRTVDMVGDISDLVSSSAEAATGAVGQSIAAYLGEGKASAKAMKEMAHQLAMGIAAQSAQKAAWEFVQAAAYGVLLQPLEAGKHLAAGAIYAGFAGIAGLAARATYTPPASAGTTPTSVRGSSAGTGGGSARSSGGGDTTIVFNINGMIGDNADLIRKIGEGFDAYKRKTGRSPFGNN